MVQEMLGQCEAKGGTEIDELLQAGASRHKRAQQDVETNSDPRRRQVPCQRGGVRRISDIEGDMEPCKREKREGGEEDQRRSE